MTNSKPTTDPIIELVCKDLLQRSQIGIAKYGTTLARTDLSLKDWLQHAYEECLDQANYLKRSIVELEAKESAIVDTFMEDQEPIYTTKRIYLDEV